jgi:hypothetical protein
MVVVNSHTYAAWRLSESAPLTPELSQNPGAEHQQPSVTVAPDMISAFRALDS